MKNKSQKYENGYERTLKIFILITEDFFLISGSVVMTE